MKKTKERAMPLEDLNTYLTSFPKVELLKPHETIALGRMLRETISDSSLFVPGEDEQIEEVERSEEDIALDLDTCTSLDCSTPEQAKHRLILSNTRLVVAEAIKFSKRGTSTISVMDLISEGFFGLFDASRRFDPERKCKFSTYATWWIRRYIRKALTSTRAIKIPYYMYSIVAKLPWAECKIVAKVNRSPTRSELSDEMDCEEKEIDRTMKAISTTKVFNVQSETPAGDPTKSKEDTSYNTEQENKFYRDQSMVWEAIGKMSDDKAFVVMLRYGFLKDNMDIVNKIADANGWKFEVKKLYTFENIGEIFGLTREKARALERSAVDEFQSKYIDVVKKERSY